MGAGQCCMALEMEDSQNPTLRFGHDMTDTAATLCRVSRNCMTMRAWTTVSASPSLVLFLAHLAPCFYHATTAALCRLSEQARWLEAQPQQECLGLQGWHSVVSRSQQRHSESYPPGSQSICEFFTFVEFFWLRNTFGAQQFFPLPSQPSRLVLSQPRTLTEQV